MTSILNLLLYDRKIKNIANRLLDWPLFTNNPIFKILLKKKIEKVISQFKLRPFALRIENTNVCNARCFMCPHSSMKRKQGFMDRKLYKKIIDEAVRLGIDFVNLHNFGEPLLDQDFIWRVKYAKEKGIKKISTNTNAQLLTREMSSDLIESGLDELYVSLDAAGKKVYKSIRIGLDFDKVTGNVKYLAAMKKKMGVTHPQIIVDFLESDLNNREKSKFIADWVGVADHVCISKIHDWSGKKHEAGEFLYESYVSFSQVPCRLPFTELLINWDGKASLCCQDVEGQVIVGDANKESLKEIWQGKKLAAIRKKQKYLNLKSLPLCANCKLRTFWWAF